MFGRSLRDSSGASYVARTLSLLIVASATMLASCAKDAGLEPFTSDGCSLFPDRSRITRADWCDCCFEHDIAYWKGGTEDERDAADEALRECVEMRTGNQGLADSMFFGVQAGGSPHFFTWYRWGYGWSYGRGYAPLTEAEQSQADELLSNYRAAGAPSACDVGDKVALWSSP